VSVYPESEPTAESQTSFDFREWHEWNAGDDGVSRVSQDRLLFETRTLQKSRPRLLRNVWRVATQIGVSVPFQCSRQRFAKRLQTMAAAHENQFSKRMRRKLEQLNEKKRKRSRRAQRHMSVDVECQTENKSGRVTDSNRYSRDSASRKQIKSVR
jgi:hypothetical protein